MLVCDSCKSLRSCLNLKKNLAEKAVSLIHRSIVRVLSYRWSIFCSSSSSRSCSNRRQTSTGVHIFLQVLITTIKTMHHYCTYGNSRFVHIMSYLTRREVKQGHSRHTEGGSKCFLQLTNIHDHTHVQLKVSMCYHLNFAGNLQRT